MKRFLVFLLVLACMLPSAVCFAADAPYSIGDKAEDFSVTLTDGSQVTLYGLLDEYKAVYLNFFFIGCAHCEEEFPFMEKAYEDYADDIAVLAVSPLDEVDEVAAYKKENGFTFLVGAVEYGTLEEAFGIPGFPTSFVIDREGIICRKEMVLTSPLLFDKIFSVYTAEDYVSPTFDFPREKPADLGIPVTLEGDELQYQLTFDNGQSLPDGAKKVVPDVVYDGVEPLDVYLVPACEGELRLQLGPDTPLDGYAVNRRPLSYLDCDEEGLFLPVKIVSPEDFDLALIQLTKQDENGEPTETYLNLFLLHEDVPDHDNFLALLIGAGDPDFSYHLE